MKKIFPFAIVPAILVAGVGLFLHAQDPQPERTAGKVLLMKTGHAMEGDVERIGAQFCVRRGKSEVWVAADKAVRLCTDWKDAYAYAQTLIKKDDAGDRVKLARWCHMNRLTEQALGEARKALELDADHAEAKQLVTQLERILKDSPAKTTPAVTPVAAKKETAPAPAPIVDVSFETFVSFATKVQPILMNTCATCHATGHGGQFHLERVIDSSKKTLTQHNLAAVLTQIDLDRPAISPLLVKAITPHGGNAAPPIKDRSALPLQAMQQWIEQTIAKNPQLKDYAAAKKPVQPKTEGGSNFAAPPGKDAKVTSVSRGVAETEAPMPKTWSPRDEFDADIFNRWAHPKR